VSTSDAKEILRRSARSLIDAMSPEERARASRVIVDHITGSGWWRGADAVLIYAGDATEPTLDLLIESSADQGKSVCVPAIDWARKSMHPRLVRSASDLVPGRHGIRVPGDGCTEIDPDRLGLVLVPGVAFDPEGGRLGRGGGFYDRFLASWRGSAPMREGGAGPVAIGVGFAAQVVARVPTDGHDQRLDGLVTDAGPVDR